MHLTERHPRVLTELSDIIANLHFIVLEKSWQKVKSRVTGKREALNAF